MKLKHNKKRNTAFLYEVLVRNLTKAVIDQDEEKKSVIVSIVREHFSSSCELIKSTRPFLKTLLMFLFQTINP
jgi:hypothetical protein